MVKFVLKYCVQEELLNLKDSKLTQKIYGNKTGFEDWVTYAVTVDVTGLNSYS